MGFVHRAFLSCLFLNVSLLAGPATSSAAEYVWDLPNVFSANSSSGVADQVFAELVAQKTDGRIEIVHHFSGSLGYEGVDHLTAVADGALVIARMPLSYLSGYSPLFRLTSLPFLMHDKDDVDTLYRIVKPYYEELFLEHNQVYLSMSLFPPSGIWSREPVASVEDLGNLKIRAFDVNSMETFTNAGAAAINMGWSDVLPALSTGAIDAVVTSADLGIASNIQDFLPHFTEINWTIPFGAITINKQVWDQLPEELQQAVREAGEETTQRTFARLVTQVAENYEEMRSKGVEIIADPPETFLDHLHQAAEPTISTWKEKAGPTGREILSTYREQAGN